LFDLNITKIMILAVLGLLIFGPEQLPRMAAQAGQALRDLRKLAEKASSDLRENLGPEYADFDFNDLNPRTFVRKHLLDPMSDDEEQYSWNGSAEVPGEADFLDSVPIAVLDVGEIPPYDSEAT
jgi:sec-independent protein translocase protein TatB